MNIKITADELAKLRDLATGELLTIVNNDRVRETLTRCKTSASFVAEMLLRIIDMPETKPPAYFADSTTDKALAAFICRAAEKLKLVPDDDAVRAAVSAEREACAILALGYHRCGGDNAATVNGIAADIRARKP